MKKVLISFIGTGSSEGKYQETTYDNFPNGKQYSSNLFLKAFLDYKKEEDYYFDDVYVIGTYTSDWCSLLENNPENEEIKEKICDIQKMFSCDDSDAAIDILGENLEKIVPELEKAFSVENVYPIMHSFDVNQKDIPDIYSAYHAIVDSLSDEDCEITMDVTHSMRYMPLICHQAMSEYGITLDHLIYGEYQKNTNSHFRDLSLSCKISRVNKALNAINNKLDFSLLSHELSDSVPELADILNGLNEMLAYSVMSKCQERIETFRNAMEYIDDYASQIIPFDSVKKVLSDFLFAVADFNEDFSSYTDTFRNICIMLKVSELYQRKNMFTQTALANEAVLQLLVMDRIYVENGQEEYQDFLDEYTDLIKREKTGNCKKMMDIKNTRNNFAHCYSDSIDDLEKKFNNHRIFLLELAKERLSL